MITRQEQRSNETPEAHVEQHGITDTSLHAMEAYKNELCSPNTANILAHLGCISALELTELRITLDLEEYFLARRCYDLLRQGCKSDHPFIAEKARAKGRKRTLTLIVSGFSGLTSS
jgi:hypothetical protein